MVTFEIMLVKDGGCYWRFDRSQFSDVRANHPAMRDILDRAEAMESDESAWVIADEEIHGKLCRILDQTFDHSKIGFYYLGED